MPDSNRARRLTSSAMPHEARWTLPVAIAATVVVWASAFVGIRAALPDLSPAHLALIRFVCSSIVLALIAIKQRAHLPERRHWPIMVITGLLGFTIYNLLLNIGEKRVEAGTTSIIVATVPIWMLLLGGSILGERVTVKAGLGVVISFAGIVLATMATGKRISFEWAAVVVLAAALANALYYMFLKRLTVHYAPLRAVSYATWTGTIALLPFAGGIGAELSHAKTSSILWTVYLGVVPSVIGNVCWSYTLKRLSAARAGSFLYLIAPTVILIAWPILGEVPGLVTLAGGALVILGIVIVNHERAKPPAAPIPVATRLQER